MGTRFPRTVALFLLLSLILAPNSVLMAQELSDQPAATPIVTETETPDSPDELGTPDPGSEDGSDLDEPEIEIPAGTPDMTLSAERSGVAPLTEPGTFAFGPWGWNGSALESTLLMAASFEAEAGDTFTIRYTSDSLSLDPGPYTIAGLPVEVTANDATETLTLTFTQDYMAEPAGGEAYVEVDLVFPGTVIFPGVYQARIAIPTRPQLAFQRMVYINSGMSSKSQAKNANHLTEHGCFRSITFTRCRQL